MPELTLTASATEAPALEVADLNGDWHPAYVVRDRILDRTFATTVYVHHRAADGTSLGAIAVCEAKLGQYAAEGRVRPFVSPVPSGDGAHVEGEYVVAYEATAPDDEPMRPLSERAAAARRMPEAKTRWEAMRRLLNVRCTAWEKHTGEDATEMRHEAARRASENRPYRRDLPAGFRAPVSSSMALDLGGAWGSDEMEHAVSFVEDLLVGAGYDLDAADAEYRARQARRAGTSSAWEVSA